MSHFSDDALFIVPSPDDNDSQQTTDAIKNMITRDEPALMQIANWLKLDIDLPNTYRHVISFCFRMNITNRLLNGHFKDTKEEKMDLYQCIQAMKRLEIENPGEQMHFRYLCSKIGLDYRREWLSLV